MNVEIVMVQQDILVKKRLVMIVVHMMVLLVLNSQVGPETVWVDIR